MNLYEVATLYRNALETGDAEAIENASTDMIVKARNVVGWVLERDAQCLAIKSERDRLDALLKSEQSKAEWAREWLKVGMIQSGMDKINLNTMVVSLRNNPPSVEVQAGALENGLIPDKFIRVKTERSVDKTAAKKALLEDGEIIAGCTIIRGQSIQIK